MAVSGVGKRRIKITAQGDSIAGRMHIRYMRWLGGTAAGHQLVINDTNGNMVWESEADGPNFNDLHPLFDWVDGLSIATMQSGRVLIYVS